MKRNPYARKEIDAESAAIALARIAGNPAALRVARTLRIIRDYYTYSK